MQLFRDVEVPRDLVHMIAADDRAHVYVGAFVGAADLHLARLVDEVVDQAHGNVADADGDGAGHAALAGAAEGAGLQRVDGLVEVGIGHDDEMVFGAAGSLHALAVFGAGFVNVFRNSRRAYEGDRCERFRRCFRSCADGLPLRTSGRGLPSACS